MNTNVLYCVILGLIILIIISKILIKPPPRVNVYQQQLQQIYTTYNKSKAQLNIFVALLMINQCLAHVQCLKNLDVENQSLYIGFEYELQEEYKHILYDLQKLYPNISIN